MPFIKPKKTDAAALSWDAFPPPPPEAQTWKPDPNSIARPGDLPDPRFNRNPQALRSRFAMKSKPSYSVSSSPSPSTSKAAPAQGLGEWSASTPRATGYPRDLVRDTSPPTPSIRSLELKAPALDSYSGGAKPIRSAVAVPTKGTIESIPNYHRPQRTVTSIASLNTVPPAKDIPAWAVPLEKALAEDTAKVQTRPDMPRTTSVPLHLRNNENIIAEEDQRDSEALAWKVATTNLGVQNAKQVLQLQTELLKEHAIQEPARKCDDQVQANYRPKISHVHKIKVMLIRAMEAELDLSKVATERELLAMNGDEIDKYDDKVRSAHKHWFETQQRS